MREMVIYLITFFIILILSLTILIQHAYYYRKIIKNTGIFANILKRKYNKKKY
jgi:hypothetical protein